VLLSVRLGLIIWSVRRDGDGFRILWEKVPWGEEGIAGPTEPEMLEVTALLKAFKEQLSEGSVGFCNNAKTRKRIEGPLDAPIDDHVSKSSTQEARTSSAPPTTE